MEGLRARAGDLFTVLVVLLRSIVVPLKAVIVNLLAVGAAYGALVAVFHWVLDGPLGSTRPVTWIRRSPDLFALVFGLSMDYKFPALARARRFELTGDSRRAVAENLASSAASITSAAAIMVAVFALSSRPACRRSRRWASAARLPWRSTRRSCGSFASRRRSRFG